MSRIKVKCRPGKRKLFDGIKHTDEPREVPLTGRLMRHIKAGRLLIHEEDEVENLASGKLAERKDQ